MINLILINIINHQFIFLIMIKKIRLRIKVFYLIQKQIQNHRHQIKIILNWASFKLKNKKINKILLTSYKCLGKN